VKSTRKFPWLAAIIRLEIASMKILFGVGLLILVLGILSFFIPVPHTERHGIDAGDVHLGVNTHHDEMLPPYVGVGLLVVGAGLMIAGRKRGA
jgi:hypothetical protein